MHIFIHTLYEDMLVSSAFFRALGHQPHVAKNNFVGYRIETRFRVCVIAKLKNILRIFLTSAIPASRPFGTSGIHAIT